MIERAPVTDDEFAAWLHYPATRWIMQTAQILADDRKAAWIAASWDGGSADPAYLRELRGQADAHLWLATIDYEAVCAAIEQDPVTESR